MPGRLAVSSGTAQVLGLSGSRGDCAPTTLYLLVGDNCSHACGFCPRARDSSSRSRLLSRVTWPEFQMDDIVEAAVAAYERGEAGRLCIQTVTSKGAWERVLEVVVAVRRVSAIPISVSTQPSMVRAKEALEAGANMVGLPLDTASPVLFRDVKGGSFEGAIKEIKEASARFPGRISTHLVAGLGETEEDMLRLIQTLYDWGVTVALFAFTPVKGTRLERRKAPGLASYRRLQAARHLISSDLARFTGMTFEDGRLIRLGVGGNSLMESLSDGEAFRTSGCPSCNRPYYNESPRGPFFNYPRPLKGEEIRSILQDLAGVMGLEGDPS